MRIDPIPAEAVPGGEPPVDVLYVGETYVDLAFAGVEPPGWGEEVYAKAFAIGPGGIANKAVASARLGQQVGLVTRLGIDPLGCMVWRDLSEEPGLSTAWVERLAGWQTPVSVALTGSRERSFISYREPERHESSVVSSVEAVACCVNLRQLGSPWVASLREKGARIYVEAGWDETGRWDRASLELLQTADVFSVNESEAIQYSRHETVGEAARYLSSFVPLVLVTQGARGAIAVNAHTGEAAVAAAPAARAVDPTGAGDVFLAAFIAAERETAWTLQERLSFASVCATLSVERFGSARSAPSIGEVNRFLLERADDPAVEILRRH